RLADGTAGRLSVASCSPGRGADGADGGGRGRRQRLKCQTNPRAGIDKGQVSCSIKSTKMRARQVLGQVVRVCPFDQDSSVIPHTLMDPAVVAGSRVRPFNI